MQHSEGKTEGADCGQYRQAARIAGKTLSKGRGSMVRYLAFLVGAFFVLSSTYVAAQPQQTYTTYTVSSWPGGIKDLPCSAFRKNGPDSWTLIANVYAGGMIMSNVTFGKGDESKMIEEKCGTK